MENLHKAIGLLGTYSGGRFDIWALAGNARASCRAHVMAVLIGKDRVPQSQAGINALRSAFYSACSIEGECEATRESNFKAYCRKAGAA